MAVEVYTSICLTYPIYKPILADLAYISSTVRASSLQEKVGTGVSIARPVSVSHTYFQSKQAHERLGLSLT